MIPAEDLKMETWPFGHHPGGQYVGTHPTIKLTHIPTDTVAVVSVARSQHKNKAIALEMIEAALTHPFTR